MVPSLLLVQADLNWIFSNLNPISISSTIESHLLYETVYIRINLLLTQLKKWDCNQSLLTDRYGVSVLSGSLIANHVLCYVYPNTRIWPKYLKFQSVDSDMYRYFLSWCWVALESVFFIYRVQSPVLSDPFKPFRFKIIFKKSSRT